MKKLYYAFIAAEPGEKIGAVVWNRKLKTAIDEREWRKERGYKVSKIVRKIHNF
jgi:hypothetical protein